MANHTPKSKTDLNPFADLELRSLRDYIMIIRERWILALSIALVASAALGYYLINRPAVYEADSKLLIERQGERVVDIEQVVDTGLEGHGSMWQAILQNHIQQLSSRNFREYVVASLTDAERRRFLAPYLPDVIPTDDPVWRPPNPVTMLEKQVEIDNLRNTFVLKVNVRHRDPGMAELIANRYADRYIHFVMDRSTSGNYAAINFLRERAEELRERLEEADGALQAYRETHNLVSVEENQGIVVERLKQVSSAVTTTRVARLDLESQLRQIEEFQREGRNLLEIRAIASYGATQEHVNDLDRLRKEREVMSERYGERHPRMVDNARAIEAAQSLIRNNTREAVAEIRTRLRDVVEKEQSLREELADAERESLRLDRLAIEYQVLRRNADSARATYDQIIHRLHETTITSQLESSNIKIVDSAAFPINPVEPNKKRVALMVLFVAGFFFVGIPIGLEFFDNKLKTAWDVEGFLNTRLMAVVPDISKVSEGDRFHVVEREVDDGAAEAFRGLVSQMEIVSDVQYPKCLLVTSTVPGEGKTFTTANFAQCLANHGRRVLLLDADLRHPRLHSSYGLDNSAGMLKWLQEAQAGAPVDFADPLLGLHILSPNLHLLRSGGHTKKATETIGRPQVEELLEACRKNYDVVLIDTPPVGVFPDALALSRFADECLYVVRHDKVDRQQVKNYMDRLRETQAHMLGVAMNAMPANRGASYQYYQGYGYGYQAEQYRKYYAKAK